MKEKETNDKVIIRTAKPEDAEALLKIYAPYVEETAISFEYETPSVEEFRRRIEKTLEKYPYLVAELNGEPAGYCYASPFKERDAYSWGVEMTIYIRRDCRKCGLGKRLYEKLEAILKAQDILNLNACIAYPHPESIAFHEKMGYQTVAHFHKCGYKLGKWLDMVWMEKMLSEHPDVPKPVIPFSKLDEETVGACLE